MAPRKPPPLRVAQPGEVAPEPERAKTLKEATERTERELLVAMRSRLASEIDSGVPAAYLAPLTRQLREIDKEIRLLDRRAEQEGREGVSSPDEDLDASAL